MNTSFVDSLSAKVHSSPPTIEKIADLFQDFYIRAESHIATHISALASRINRDPSPHLPPKNSRDKSKDNAAASRQMLTASEVAEKRKARKFLSYKRVALEEAVERRACEAVYDKIWRHRTTLDEVRDEKLRSKTAALLLVGINLKDLGIDIDISTIDEDKQKEADDCISVARECLAKMNEEKYPLGKLQHLSYAHKAIVDALTKLLPSSSSADEILPTLIYTLITCPPEGINVISNFLFIQRFRSSSKMDGETAYCLTNIEASITFLENVDLSELRADEMQTGQVKADSASSEKTGPFDPTKEAAAPSVAPVSASPEFLKSDKDASNTLPRAQPSAPQQQRGLNTLFQPPSKMLGAANDAVRSTADQGIKNIGASLDTSFNFVFGRLKEFQTGKDDSIPILPKTLAEARRLVAYPASGDNKSLTEEDNTAKGPLATDRPPLRHVGSKAEETFMGLVSGRRTPRDRSADSTRTQGSSKKSSIAAGSLRGESSPGVSQPSPMTLSASTPLDSVRNFGNTLNPLNHIPGVIRNFGRSASDSPGAPASPALPERAKAAQAQAERPSSGSSSIKSDPPIQRFLDTQHASELTIGDVSTLLDDYKRLAAVLLKQNANSS